MASSYKMDVLTGMIHDELDKRPRGTPSRLAEHMGVTPQTITKWRKGEVNPEPDRWPLLEQFFGWPAGEIAGRVLPLDEGNRSLIEMVNELASQVEALNIRLGLVEAGQSRRRRP